MHIVIYPYHAQIVAMFEAAGLAGVFDEWKAILAGEVAQIKAAHPGIRITLWDFSGFSSLHCEPIPVKGDRSATTKWYWEAGHFKPALGDVVLARVLGDSTHLTSSASFGFALSPANLGVNRARIARERSECALAQPQLVADAHTMIADAREAAR